MQVLPDLLQEIVDLVDQNRDADTPNEYGTVPEVLDAFELNLIWRRNKICA